LRPASGRQALPRLREMNPKERVQLTKLTTSAT